MIIVDLVSCRQPQRPRSINSIPTSQVEAVEVEAFLSSQGSRKGNVGKSTIVYPSVIRAHTLPILRIEKGANPGSMKAFAKILLVAIMSLECCYPELFSFCSPSRSILQIVGPHPFQCRGRTTPWRCSAIFFRNRTHAAETPRADHCPALCCPHQIPRLVYMTVAACCGHKREALYQEPPILKPHIRLSSASPPLLFFLQLVLATLTLPISPICSVPRRASCSSVFVHDVEKKLRSRPEKGLEPCWHPWPSPWKSSSRFAGRW
jgi:hypothetical protein